MFEWLHQHLQQFSPPAGLHDVITSSIIIAAILLFALVVDWITKRLLIRTVHTVFKFTKSQWDDVMVRQHVLSRLAHLAPALVIHLLAELPFPENTELGGAIQRAVSAYMIFVGAFVVSACINAAVDIINGTPIGREKPTKSYAQVVKILVFIVAAIFIISILMDSSPWGLLSGIGAMTAIIMLVFKDTILGFVSSVQLAANEMLRPGDWVEMPKYGADGEVMDITLTTVKVRNWDNTITTLPTYALISDAFKNWRGMSESGGRRIKRSIQIDMNSVRFCTAEEIVRYRKIQDLSDYIEKKIRELKDYNESHQVDLAEPVNGRRLTNVGTFRAYVRNYLKKHPKIHGEMTQLVRHLSPGAQGLPIEIYVFTNDTDWGHYEDIQADIFDHILAILPEFGLRVFQEPTGRDFNKLGNLS